MQARNSETSLPKDNNPHSIHKTESGTGTIQARRRIIWNSFRRLDFLHFDVVLKLSDEESERDLSSHPRQEY